MSLTVTELPPLELGVELVDAEGRSRYLTGRGSEPAEDRPQDIRSTCKRGEGFSTANFTLPRDPDSEYRDLGLFDTVRLAGPAGVAWEGRIARPAGSTDGGRSITVECVGWIAHARDRKASMVFIDREYSRWSSPSTRRVAELTDGSLGAYFAQTGSTDTRPDSSGSSTFVLSHAHMDNATGPPLRRSTVEAWYDAGADCRIAQVLYAFTTYDLGNGPGAISPVGWRNEISLYDVDYEVGAPGGTEGSGPLGPGPATGAYTALGRNRRFAAARFRMNTDLTGDGDWQLRFSDLAVIGDHGIPLVDGGLTLSDLRRYVIEAWCPKLDASGITASGYPLQHLAFTDRTAPYDMLLELGKYDLHELAVWEDRKVTTGPADLTDYDWQVRLDDPGVATTLQGDSTEELVNGLDIEYDDVNTGRHEVLLAANYAELRDDTVEHPANRHGIEVVDTVTLTSSTDGATALALGRLMLAERNQPKATGTITVGPYVRDRAGNLQPYWKVRTGQTIRITSSTSLSDRPRMIVDAEHDHWQRRVTLSTDNTLRRTDALQDRLTTALRARNLI